MDDPGGSGKGREGVAKGGAKGGRGYERTPRRRHPVELANDAIRLGVFGTGSQAPSSTRTWHCEIPGAGLNPRPEVIKTNTRHMSHQHPLQSKGFIIKD